MRYAYFPGCCDHTSAKEYDISTRAVCKKLGIELVEIPDWSCCGSSPGHSISHLLGVSLAARNLALVEEMGLNCTASCASCYQRLAMANIEMKNDAQLSEKINWTTGRPYHGNVNVYSILEVFDQIDPAQLQSQVIKPLKNLKIAVYYGCLLVRPKEVQIDNPENPLVMDNLMQTIGAQKVDWGYKTECCGAGMAMCNEDIVLRLTNKIFKDASMAGANCIVTACPLCHFNLDMRQKKVNKAYGTAYNLPVFYFTQLVGLTMGLNADELSLNTHFIDTKEIVKLVSSEKL